MKGMKVYTFQKEIEFCLLGLEGHFTIDDSALQLSSLDGYLFGLILHY